MASPENFPPKVEDRNNQHSIQKTPAIPSSLSAVKETVEKKPILKKEATSGITPNPIGESPKLAPTHGSLDLAKLRDLLDQIILDFRAKDRHMEISVIRQGFTIQKDRVIFVLSGEIQKDIFLKLKPELTGLIREGLQNSLVEISFETGNNHEPSKKLYTSTDKLLYLTGKSPALKELQKRFGLETDF